MALNINVCKSIIVVVFLIICLSIAVNFYLLSNEHTNVSAYEQTVGSDGMRITTPRNTTDMTVDSIYFTTTTLSSVGYGDILPITNVGKLAVACQQFVVFMLSIGILTISCSGM